MGTTPNPLQDKDFLAAPITLQRQYLAHVDPDFAKAKPDEQQAYLNHLRGLPPPTTENNAVENASAKEGGFKEAAKGILKGPLQDVAPISRAINKIPKVGEFLAPSAGVNAEEAIAKPANKSQEIGSKAEHAAEWLIPIGKELGGAAEAGRLIPFAKRAATSAVGSLVGGEAGKYAGHMVGLPQVGETLGGLAGGLAGGGAFGEGARKIGNPSELPVIGKYLPDLLEKPPTPAVSSTPFELTPPAAASEPAVQNTLHFPKAAPPAPPPVVSPEPFNLTPPAAAAEPAVQNPLDFPKSVPAAKAEALPELNLQPMGAPPAEKPSGMRKLNSIVDEQLGAKPLEKNVPLREQAKSAAKPIAAAEEDAIKKQYPDSADRQMVRANGPEIFEAAKGDPETLKAIHDLTRVDLREALINAGEDMGQTTVSNSKFAGEGSITRQEAFKRLLAKNLTPGQIVNMSKPVARAKAAAEAIAPGAPTIGPLEPMGGR
jgi:hypothetical protein